MSRLFGPLRQMGFVVRDIEAAMRHWVEVCGVGPWFYADRLPLTSRAYLRDDLEWLRAAGRLPARLARRSPPTAPDRASS